MLVRALSLCLKIGNILNRGSARGNAKGFDVSVLPSLAAIKASTDTQFSLLHFIAQETPVNLNLTCQMCNLLDFQLVRLVTC